MTEKEFRGLIGESLIERLLIDNIDVYRKVLRDINIIIDDKQTQIDNILITTKGIYVIESKNFNGLVIVNDKNDWYYYRHGDQIGKRLDYNPYQQNIYHIDMLSKTLNLENKYFKSVIVLGYNTEYDIKLGYDDCTIINIEQLCGYIIKDFVNSEDILTHEQIDNIYMLLKHNN